MLTCVLGLTACGGDVQSLKYNEAEIAIQVKNTYALVSGEYTDEHITALNELNDDELDELAEVLESSTSIKTEGKVVVAGINSFIGSSELIGNIDETRIGENMDFDASKKELIVTLPVYGDVHEGSVEVIFDKNLHITSITTNVKYSMAESMKKAGVNTAIGMGTVFIMLIVIMFIISCFSVIPKIQKSLEEKKNNKNKENESVDNAIKGIVEREEASADLTDDLELVAVIAAAIAASEGASSTDGFVVRSIRRIR